MINGTSAVNLYGMTAQAEKTQEKKSVGSTFKDVYQNKVESMDDIFEEAASVYDISVDLLKAVAKAESNFNPSAVSRAGAIGVMQLMPGTASSLGVTDPYDARQNIMGGARYLKSNLEKYNGDVSLALAAYNAGPGSVAKYGGVPPYAETQNYVKKVTSYMNGESLYTGKLVNSSTGSTSGSLGDSLNLDSLYGSSSYLNSLYGTSAMGLNSLYGSSSTGILSGLYGSSSLGGLGSVLGSSSSDDSDGLFGSSSFSSLGNVFGSSASLAGLYGTSDLAGLGSVYGSSALTGTGSLYGMSSVYGSSANLLSLLLGASMQSEEEDENSLDKDSLYNLVELMKLQLMMNVSSQTGSITI